MADLIVDIVTPEKVVYSGPAREVRAPGAGGEFGVLPGHTFFLSLLRPGIASVDTDSGTRRFVVGKGFAEAGPDKIVLLTDSCESVDQVDKAAAEALLVDAETRLAQHAPGSDEALIAQGDLEMARARLLA